MEITAKLLNVGQAAAYIGVSAASLRKWSNEGLVAVYRTPGDSGVITATTWTSS